MKSHLSLRKKVPVLFLVFLFIAFCSGCQKDIFETDNMDDQGSGNLKSAKTTNLMVITKSETLPAGFEQKLSLYRQIISSTPEIGMIVIQPANSKVKSQIAKLSEVKAVVPDLVVSWLEPSDVIEEMNPPSIGDDEYFFSLGYLWGLDAINAPEAWNTGNTGEGAKVYILDSGIDKDNPDLDDNLNTELSTSFVPGEEYFVRDGSFFSHGTHVAGTIAAADNGWGVIGVAPHAEIVAVKVLSEYSGSGAFSWVNQGIVYAANNGADVINMSLGAWLNRNGNYLDDNYVWQQAPAFDLQFLILAQQRAVNYAVKKGAVVIVSAGNEAINADGNASLFKLPADLENVIAVSATAPDYIFGNPQGSLDILASYSNYGKSLVKLAAPGGDFDFYPAVYYHFDMILSTGAGPDPATGGWYFFWAAGTSMATPHVSGVAALIAGSNGGEISPSNLIKQLFETADKIDGMGISPYYGNGRVNAYRAVTE